MNPSNSFEQAVEGIKALQAMQVEARISADELARITADGLVDDACYAAGAFFAAWQARTWQAMLPHTVTSWASQAEDAPARLAGRLGHVKVRSFELAGVHRESSTEVGIEISMRARGPNRQWIRGTYTASVVLEAGRWGIDPDSIIRRD